MRLSGFGLGLLFFLLGLGQGYSTENAEEDNVNDTSLTVVEDYNLEGPRGPVSINGSGRLNLNGHSLIVNGGTFDGSFVGGGSVTIQENVVLNTQSSSEMGRLNVEGRVYLGRGEGKKGFLTSTSVSQSGNLYIGSEKGEGELAVTGGMTTGEGSTITIGDTAGGMGSLTIGGTLEHRGTLTVEKVGEGGLRIQDLRGDGRIELKGESELTIERTDAYSGVIELKEESSLTTKGEAEYIGRFDTKGTVKVESDVTLTVESFQDGMSQEKESRIGKFDLQGGEDKKAKIVGRLHVGEVTQGVCELVIGEDKEGEVQAGGYSLSGGKLTLGSGKNGLGRLQVQALVMQGTTTQGNMTIEAGSSLVLGQKVGLEAEAGQGEGSLNVGGTLRNDGQITVNSADSFQCSALSGNGTIYMEPETELTIACSGTTDGTFEGNFTGEGQLLVQGKGAKALNLYVRGILKKFTTVGDQRVDFRRASTEAVKISEFYWNSTGRFLLGNATSPITLQCNKFHVKKGAAEIGVNGSRSTLDCADGVIIAEGEEFSIGRECNSWPGQGMVQTGSFNLKKGKLTIGTANNANSSGMLVVTGDMTTAEGTTAMLGNGAGSGALSVGGTLTNCGDILVNHLLSSDSLNIGFLKGNGKITISNASMMTITAQKASQQEDVFRGVVEGNGILYKGTPYYWGFSPSSCQLSKIWLKNGYLNIGLHCSRSVQVTATDLVVEEDSRFTCGDHPGSQAEMTCTNVLLSNSTFMIGACNGATGALTCTTYKQASGTTFVGYDDQTNAGTGILKVQNYVLEGGILGIGDCDSTDGLGQLEVSGKMTTGEGSTITIGETAGGTGSLTVNGQLDHFGALNVVKLPTVDSLQICCLTGQGTIDLASGTQLTFTGATGTTSAFMGKITGSGDLVYKGPAAQTSYFNPQKTSKFKDVRIDQGRLSIGWKAEAGFTCENIFVATGTGFWLGDNADANAVVTCNSFTTFGDVDIGARYATSYGELVVNRDLSQKGGDFSVGCSGANANPGRGCVRAQNIHLISGSFRVANCTANSSGHIYATEMTVDSSFTQVYVGYGETGRNAGFEIEHILTNNCANFDVNCADGLTVGGLSGSGVFKMYYGSVVTITDGLDQVFQGMLQQSGGGGCQLIKDGDGVQVLTGISSSYSGGTTINRGWLCGQISFNGNLKIGLNGAYLLATRTPTEDEKQRAEGQNVSLMTHSSCDMTASLSGELSGTGVLDLAGGQLKLLRSSSFDGLITNSNTDLDKTILFIENGVNFVAGGQSHTACGKIQFSSGKSWTYLEGKFPNCVLSGSDSDVFYARNIDCECRGFADKVNFAFGKNIIVTYGFELDDFTHKGRAWSNADQGSDLPGGLIKRGAGRQIIYGGSGYTFNTGETRVEGGVLAGVIPCRAPLFVDVGAMYQVSCYDGSGKNATGVTKQTVTALRGKGLVAFAAAGTEDELTVNVAVHATETFEGQTTGHGILTIQGEGEQIFNGQLNNTTICARGGTTTFESLVQGPQQVNVEGGTLNITGGLTGGTLRLKSANSRVQISSGAHVNTTLQTEADNATLQALSSVAIVTDCHIDHALNVMTPDNVAFALNGRLSGSGLLLKQGEGDLVFNEMIISSATPQLRSSATSCLQIDSGRVTFNSNVLLRQPLAVTVSEGSVLDLHTSPTLTSLHGTGHVGLHAVQLTLDLPNGTPVATPFVCEHERNSIFVKEKTTFKSGILKQFQGTLSVAEGVSLTVSEELNDKITLFPRQGSILYLPEDHVTVGGLMGRGNIEVASNSSVGQLSSLSTLTIKSDKAQAFFGDISGTYLQLQGHQTFYWGGAAPLKLSHSEGIELKDSSSLVVAAHTQLNSREFITLGKNTHLFLNSAQTFCGFTGEGAVHLLDDCTLDLDGNATFSGDIYGSGTLYLTAKNLTEFSWTGENIKNFRGKIITDNVVFRYSGATPRYFLSCYDTIDDSLNLHLKNETVTISCVDEFISGGVAGPGTLRIHLPSIDDTFTVNEGIFSSDRVKFEIECGTVRLKSGKSYFPSSFYFKGPQARLIVSDPQNLSAASQIVCEADSGILRFENKEQLILSSEVDLHESLRIQICGGSVNLAGSLNYTAEISKEGEGCLTLGRGVEKSPRSWVVKEGGLAGSFNSGSRIELLKGASLKLTADQTLSSLSATSGSQLQVENACVTLGNCDFSGFLCTVGSYRLRFAGPAVWDAHMEQQGTQAIQDNPTGTPLYATVDGTLEIRDPQTFLCDLEGSGCIKTERPLTLQIDRESTYDGSFLSSRAITKTGTEKLTLTGDLKNFTGNWEVCEGVLAASPEAVFGGAQMIINGGIYEPQAASNFEGELLLQNGTLRTRNSLELCNPIYIASATFAVDSALALSSPLLSSPLLSSPLLSSPVATVVKTGNGILAFSNSINTQQMSLTVSEGCFEARQPLHVNNLNLEIGNNSTAHFFADQSLTSLSGHGRLIADGDLLLQFPVAKRFDGTVSGYHRLNIASSVTFTNPDLAKDFTGVWHIAKRVHCFVSNPLQLTQLTGEGDLSCGGHSLTLCLSEDSEFAGTLSHVGQFSVKSADDLQHTFMYAGESSSLSLALDRTHFVAKKVFAARAINLSETSELTVCKRSSAQSLQGAGIINIRGDSFTCQPSGENGFSGDFSGSGVLHLKDGDFTWCLESSMNAPSRFKSKIEIINSKFSVNAHCHLNPLLRVNLSEGGEFHIRCDQSIAELTGVGTAYLNGYTLSIIGSDDRNEAFEGDFEDGTVEITPSFPWAWKKGRKKFTGALRLLPGAQAKLDHLGDAPFALDLGQGTRIDIWGETVLRGRLTTSGPVLPKIVCHDSITIASETSFSSPAMPLAFFGDIEGSAPLTLHDVSFKWKKGSKSSSVLALTGVSECTLEEDVVLDPSENVSLGQGTCLNAGRDLTLQTLRGQGDLNMNGHTLTLLAQADDTFEGTLSHASHITFRGKHTYSVGKFEELLDLTLEDAATLLWRNSTTFDHLTLASAAAAIELEADLTCQSIKGCGRICCHRNTLALFSDTTLFNGDISNGNLLLNDGQHFTYAGSARRSLIGQIHLKASSTFTKEKEVTLDPHESFVADEGTQMIFRGPTTLSRIEGCGDVVFDDLTLQPDQDMAFGGKFMGTGTLRFCQDQVVASPSSKIHLTGKSNDFTGQIFCLHQNLILDRSFQANAHQWIIADHSKLFLNTDRFASDVTSPQTTWVFSGENAVIFGEENLHLLPTLFLQNRSSVTLETPFDVTLAGALQGNAALKKRGKGQVTLAGVLQWTGEVDVQEGSLRFNPASTRDTSFALNLAEGAEVRADCDLNLHQLSGRGILHHEGDHKTRLYVENDCEISAQLYGGTLDFRNSTPFLASVTLSGLSKLDEVLIPKNVSVSSAHALSLGEGARVDVSGRLRVLTETISSLHIQDGSLVCSESLLIQGDGTRSILQGFLSSPIFNFDVQDGTLQLLSDLETQTLQIQRGTISSDDNLSTVENVILESQGKLTGSGVIQNLHWIGTLSSEYLSHDKNSSFFTLRRTEIEPNARLDLYLKNNSFDNLNFTDTPCGLENIIIVLHDDEKRLEFLTNAATFTILSLPRDIEITDDTCPTLSTSEGLLTQFREPLKTFSLSHYRNNLSLYIHPFTSEDLF